MTTKVASISYVERSNTDGHSTFNTWLNPTLLARKENHNAGARHALLSSNSFQTCAQFVIWKWYVSVVISPMCYRLKKHLKGSTPSSFRMTHLWSVRISFYMCCVVFFLPANLSCIKPEWAVNYETYLLFRGSHTLWPIHFRDFSCCCDCWVRNLDKTCRKISNLHLIKLSITTWFSHI